MKESSPIPVKIDSLPAQIEKARDILGIDRLSFQVADVVREITCAKNVERIDICTFTATGAIISAMGDILIRPANRNIRILLPTRIDHNTCSRFLDSYIKLMEKTESQPLDRNHYGWPRGVEIRTFPDPEKNFANKPVMHAKVLSAYTSRGSVHLFGSCNFSHAGLSRNVEAETLLANPDGGLVGENLRNAFEFGWEHAIPLSCESANSKVSEVIASGIPVEELHDYQEDCIRQLWQKVKRDIQHTRDEETRGHVLLLPTAAGKTLVAVELSLRHLVPQCKVVWLSHLDELLGQAQETFRRQMRANNAANADAKLGVLESSSHDPSVFSTNDVIFTTDRMLCKFIEQSGCDSFDELWSGNDDDKASSQNVIFIVDEAHRFHTHAGQYMTCYEFFQPSSMVGLTATPAILRSPFRRMWHSKSVPDSIRTRSDYVRFEKDLEKTGILALLRGEIVDTGFKFELSSARKSSPEMQIVTRVREFDKRKVNEKVVETYRSRCMGQKTLIFAVTIEHASKLVKMFKSSGVDRVVEYHSGIPSGWNRPYTKSERQEIIKEYRKKDGKYDILISIYIASQGLDIPAIENLFMVRPTMSELLYAQMLGRGRRGPKSDGTEKCRIFDFTYSFINERKEVLDIVQRTLNTRLDHMSDEELMARMYLGKESDSWICPVCEKRFNIFKKSIKEKLIKNIRKDFERDLPENSRVFPVKAHVVFSTRGYHEECISVNDLHEYVENEILPSSASELPGNRIAFRYLKCNRSGLWTSFS